MFVVFIYIFLFLIFDLFTYLLRISSAPVEARALFYLFTFLSPAPKRRCYIGRAPEIGFDVIIVLSSWE